MNKEKWAWKGNSNMSEEEKKVFEREKEATKKAINEHIKENSNLLTKIESQSKDILSNVNEEDLEKLEIKKDKLEDEIKVLENEIITMRENAKRSKTEKGYQQKMKDIKIKEQESESKMKEVKEIEGYLIMKKKEVRNITPNLN
ncbi:MAG: hypothetical protein WC264_02795 [Candidatus Paceibacterota bacterium]|jgi:hypothetical protein